MDSVRVKSRLFGGVVLLQFLPTHRIILVRHCSTSYSSAFIDDGALNDDGISTTYTTYIRLSRPI